MADDWREVLDASEDAFSRGEHHEALQLADRAAHLGDEARYFAALLRGDILLELGDAAGALTAYDSAADPDVVDPEVDYLRGVALFELVRLPEAENALRSAIRGDPKLAEAYYALGLIAELTGNGQDTDLFRRARKLAPERFPAPRPLPRADFEAVVDRALTELPEPVREVLTRVPVLIAELPHLDDLCSAEPPLPPGILGMFVGPPPGSVSVLDAPSAPPTVLLFKRNLERAFTDEAELAVEIRRTVIHEVGHALGLDEDALIERGLE